MNIEEFRRAVLNGDLSPEEAREAYKKIRNKRLVELTKEIYELFNE